MATKQKTENPTTAPDWASGKKGRKSGVTYATANDIAMAIAVGGEKELAKLAETKHIGAGAAQGAVELLKAFGKAAPKSLVEAAAKQATAKVSYTIGQTYQLTIVGNPKGDGIRVSVPFNAYAGNAKKGDAVWVTMEKTGPVFHFKQPK